MQDDIDRILADEEKITPSSMFLKSAMAAVAREAAAPRPLAFPWLRALPGFLATITALIAATWNGIGSLSDPVITAVIDEQLHQFTALAMGIGLQWVVLAAAITVISLMLSSSLMRVRHSILP
jgi:hypothetical protein